MPPSPTDRIDKSITINAPVSRVWRALTDHREFGEWFRVDLESPFVHGGATRGRITYPGYEHAVMQALDITLRPEHYFSFRWHPFAVERGVDYSKEPTTLVEFRLEEAAGPGGQAGSATLLRVTESGFDAIPAERRGAAFRMNTDGWVEQLRHVNAHVAAHA